MASSLSPSSEDSTFEALELKLFGRNHLIYIACVYKSALGPLPQEYRLPKVIGKVFGWETLSFN